jgi:DNA-binding NarL/FixJ family response regulator
MTRTPRDVPPSQISPYDPIPVRALIVEDDHAWQQILSELLSDAGLPVDVADNLEQAIAHLRAAPHRLAVVDLALSGHDHRNQDGLRVLEAIRRHDPGCAPIMLTAYATVELAVSVLAEHGALTCLRKETFDRAQFRELIRRAQTAAPTSREAKQAESRPPDASESPDAEQEIAAPPGTALVVDDDAGWRSILSELLGDLGYQVRACGSYGEALGVLRREKYALAVVDLSLEGAVALAAEQWAREPQELEGYRLLASTRAGGIPTLVVTGIAAPEEIERAYAEHGVFACLQKQAFSRQAFRQLVQEARRAPASRAELDALTAREREVLELLARGLTNKEIAESLVVTTNTVKRHLKTVFEKLAVHTRSAAAAKAVNAGIPAKDSIKS